MSLTRRHKALRTSPAIYYARSTRCQLNSQRREHGVLPQRDLDVDGEHALARDESLPRSMTQAARAHLHRFTRSARCHVQDCSVGCG
jgi:hypothetical protein